ncbi:MAG: hypothetical protein ACUVR2_10320 [Anaerolineae bacterium]
MGLTPSVIAEAVYSLEAWLETMRGPDGYTGPVAHWWRNCLQFTGAGLDWRYEGIIIGYLNLYKKTGDQRWLAKARCAGDDLVQGQLLTGNYRNSSFELNPYPGGTPHEAAGDLALLHLAETLREEDDSTWQNYLKAAERNLWEYYIGVLWDGKAHHFRDHPSIPSFVPNKAATLVEALHKLAEVMGDASWIELYAQPTLVAILVHQVRGGPFDGAIAQYSQNKHMEAKFFPYYIARCVPGLLAGYAHSKDERLLDAAWRAMSFILRWRYEDGSFPQVVYPSGRVNRYPQWVAAVGDILRAMALLKAYGYEVDPEPTRSWLLQGQEPSGAFRTAWGFASQATQRPPGPLPEFRDLLPVCGWNDKAFRYLTEEYGSGGVWEQESKGVGSHTKNGKRNTEHASRNMQYETDCTVQGQQLRYREDDTTIELRCNKELLYRWRKGANWAEVCAPELWWK